MTRVPFIALVLFVASAPAFADDFSNHRDSRAFWRKEQPWRLANGEADQVKPRFTTTYTDGLARRFGMGGDHVELMSGQGDRPSLVGTVGNGAPSLALRWHPGE